MKIHLLLMNKGYQSEFTIYNGNGSESQSNKKKDIDNITFIHLDKKPHIYFDEKTPSFRLNL